MVEIVLHDILCEPERLTSATGPVRAAEAFRCFCSLPRARACPAWVTVRSAAGHSCGHFMSAGGMLEYTRTYATHESWAMIYMPSAALSGPGRGASRWSRQDERDYESHKL